MKKQNIFILLLCLLAANWMAAQDQTRTRHHPKGHKAVITEEMKTALQLTDEQRIQLEALEAETATSMEVIRQNKQELRSSRRGALKAHQTELGEILTEEQLTSLRSLRQAEHDRRRAQIEAIDHEALKAALKAYHEQHIAPVMSAQRQRLEETLSADDQASLAAIRAELEMARQKRENQQGLSEENQPERRRRKAGKGSGLKHKRNRFRTRFPEHYETLTAMVAKYDEQITSLLDAVEPQKEQWKVDKEAIRAKYIPEDVSASKRRSHSAGEDALVARNRVQGAKIHFLLQDLDGNKN